MDLSLKFWFNSELEHSISLKLLYKDKFQLSLVLTRKNFFLSTPKRASSAFKQGSSQGKNFQMKIGPIFFKVTELPRARIDRIAPNNGTYSTLIYQYEKGATPFTITETIERTEFEHLLTYISSSQSKSNY